MEYIFKADIFDLNLADLIFVAMQQNLNNLSKDAYYQLTMSFHVDLLNDFRMDFVNVPLKKWEKSETRKEKIHQLLGFQLEELDKLLCNNGLNITIATIQGEKLKSQDNIKVQLSLQDKMESINKGRKTNKPIKAMFVVPSLMFTQDTVSELAAKRLSEIYIDLMKVIRSKKIMSEILDIEITEDDKKLYEAFCKQYGGLWLPTNDEKDFLMNKLRKRAEEVIRKS